MSTISNLIGVFASLIAKRKDWAYLEILPWVALTASLAFTFQTWFHARNDAEQALQIDFDFRARNAVVDVSNRMKTYEQAMHGMVGLFANSSFVGHKEFHNYISQLRLKDYYPGIEGIRFVQIVQSTMKDRHIATIRKKLLPSYTIWPSGKRNIYAPITYAEPFDIRSQHVIGYDMLSDNEYPVSGDSRKGLRRAAMEQARDSGSSAASGKIRLLYKAERDRQNDFVMFLPVYRFGASHETIAERRANIIGWVCSVFNADGLMNGILGERNREINIKIYDGNEISDSTKMFDSQPNTQQPQHRFSAIHQIKVADRTWTVAVHSLPSFEETLDVEKPRIIAYTGILMSVFLALFFWVLLLGRKRALQTAKTLGIESRKHEMLLRTASDGIYIFDHDGNLLQVNNALCRMLGYTQEEMLGMNVAQWNEQGSASDLKANIGSLESLSFETRHRCRDGRVIDVEINTSLVEIEGRQLIYNSARDITERKRVEAKIFAVQSQLKATLEAIPDLLFEIGLDGRYHDYHSSYPELLFAPSDVFIGKTAYEVLPPKAADEVMLAVREAFERGGSFGRQIELTLPHGTFWFELSVSRKTSHAGQEPHFIILSRDITERKRVEQQLHNLTAYLQSVREEEKISIAREIHDDLGGMLTAMKIESYWLKAELSAHNMEATALFEHAQEVSKLIDGASAVMRNVISGLRPTILDDLGLLAALEWQAAHFQKLTGIKSRVNSIGDKGGLDKLRSIELFRIAQEALSNVAKHSGATCLEIEFHHNDEEVVMSIIDNGRGIAETRIDTAKHFGILGMRERADRLGGKISIDTPPGGGFNLTVILPLSASKKENT